ncbi:hypothetical protein OX283_012080 [Flavobacterium sp. SUN052]|uniref:hypothetical protein n=1 Tax=Flavobacterium sp. SUN052 TaxID=3002441 RepID=UPI00237D806A|nr:hypothetical protein [Flavobacterium sp. SUN052]MEC4005398.1 hypothetical protein [Flavobacterium sp. SUN052]
MKKCLFLFFLLVFNSSFSQNDYMSGKFKYCELHPSYNEKFNLGLEALSYKKYVGAAASIFLEITKKEPSSCDAFFWAGFSFRMLNKNKEALLCYYIADSLAQNKSIEFKQNLASISIVEGKIKLSRKKYEEIIQFFPSSPEGYYGVALTSTMIGDYENGLNNMLIAVDKYGEITGDVYYQKELLLGVLLTLNKQYDTGLIHLEECESKYRNDVNFKSHYALCLLKTSEMNKDEKMKAKAKKIYDKIENKDEISDDLKIEFKF